MAKKKTKGRDKLPTSLLKKQVSFYIQTALIKRHGGMTSVVEKCKQFLEDDGN